MLLNTPQTDYRWSEEKLYTTFFFSLRWQEDVKGKFDRRGILLALRYVEMVKTNPIYRIELKSDGSVWTLAYDLIDNFKPELKQHYEGVDELPKWVQDRLAVLMVLDPTKTNKEVEGVGRRISQDTFWVFKNGEADGGNAGEQS